MEGRLLVLLFKLVFWILRMLFLAITWPIRALLRRQRAEQTLLAPKPPRKAKQKAAPPTQQQPLHDVVQRVQTLQASARKLSALADEQRNTKSFVRTLDALVDRLEQSLTPLRRGTVSRAAAIDRVQRETAITQMVHTFITERRGPLADLLGDTDALANSCYAPIVDFCDKRGIALASDRAATSVDGDKLFFLSVDDPTGLAAIVVPSSFSTEIMTWPAIAHEIGHDFFHSVGGLPQQLRAKLELGDDFTLPRPADGQRMTAGMPTRATAAWMEELFADSFGTMMLGPAYIETMMASFGSPDEPARALACAPTSDRLRYEEHPPGHVRVLCGCRLLGQMGYGKIADELESRWRKQHGEPDYVFVPLALDQRWLRVDEAPIIGRAARVGSALYLTGLPALRGLPLRSIAGLDFGPREHESARRVANRLASSQPIDVRDARLLVAGAVLATVAAPKSAADIYALARDAIERVAVPDDLRRERSSAASDDEMRDAIRFAELIAPPLSRRQQRP